MFTHPTQQLNARSNQVRVNTASFARYASQIMIGATLASGAGNVFALCPPNLSPEETINCIRVENAGQNYSEYQEEIAALRNPENAIRPNKVEAQDLVESERDKYKTAQKIR